MTARRHFGAAVRRARLAVRHRLAPSQRTNDVVQIVDDLVALHASDPATAHLSAAVRMEEPSLEPLAAALYTDRSLIRHHAMRRTLFVFTPAVARLAHAACTVGLVDRHRRQLIGMVEGAGIADDGAAWLESAKHDVLAAVHARGEATARELGRMVPALQAKIDVAVGKPYAGALAAHTRVLQLLAFEGEIVRTRPTGTWINSEYRWSDMESWIGGGVAGLDQDTACRELARRWLRSFGPAPATDLQWWAGWSVATTKRALAASGVVEVDCDGEPGWLLADDDVEVAEPEPWVALLPGLDPTTMGWKRREWFLSAEHTSLLFDRNGNAGPSVWVDGRIVGGWVQRRDGEIVWRLLDDVGHARDEEIGAAAARISDVVGETRFTVRFPAPLQGQLLA